MWWVGAGTEALRLAAFLQMSSLADQRKPVKVRPAPSRSLAAPWVSSARLSSPRRRAPPGRVCVGTLFPACLVRAWLLRLRTVFDSAPANLPAADPVLHMSAPVRRGAVADARLGLA